MSLIPFPDVPNVPGVPAVFRSLTVPSKGQIVNALLGGIVEAIFGRVVWGVFDVSGKAALTPDTFVDIDYKNDTRVSNYPQEAGGFAAYNKVQTPFDCRVRLALGGDKASRTAFLAKCESMVKSTELFTVVTPEVTYVNATLQSYNYRRESKNGAAMLLVDMIFMEVRQTAVAAYSPAPSQPSGANPVSDGQVQTSPVSESVLVGTSIPPSLTGLNGGTTSVTIQ